MFFWRRFGLAVVLCFLICFVAGCAAGHNDLKDSPNTDGSVAGFWLGFWHGIIAPICFVISLFNNNVSIYEVHNSGALYNLGFLLGLGGEAGAASQSGNGKTKHVNLTNR
jgi:hypothetical protein